MLITSICGVAHDFVCGFCSVELNQYEIKFKRLIFIHFFFFANSGSCLSYGHSCWGAHGKRSSNDRIGIDSEQQPDRWAIFKLIQDEVIAHTHFGKQIKSIICISRLCFSVHFRTIVCLEEII